MTYVPLYPEMDCNMTCVYGVNDHAFVARIAEFGHTLVDALLSWYLSSTLTLSNTTPTRAWSSQKAQFGVCKPGEPGLAEWAQKIRALQRQVDEDEEEEHRKLKHEITPSSPIAVEIDFKPAETLS
jgi:hypothetical protein